MNLRHDIIANLRSEARKGTPPSQMLRMTLTRLDPNDRDRQSLVRYFSAAFGMKEGEGYTIFGWLPEGNGYLDDAKLDLLVQKKIDHAREYWDGEKCP